MAKRNLFQITKTEDAILKRAVKKYPLGAHTRCDTICIMSKREQVGCCGCQDVLDAEAYMHKNIRDRDLGDVFELYSKKHSIECEIKALEEKIKQKKAELKEAKQYLKDHVIIVSGGRK